MITGITRNKHGIADYSYVPLTFMAPKLMKFEDEKWASTMCYVLSATVLGYSLFTDAKWGAVKLIPYKTHAALDLSIGALTLAALPLIPQPLSRRAKTALVLLGLTSLVVGTLSLIGAKRS